MAGGKSKPKELQIDLDDIAGDLFGLNIRALQTIGIIWKKPSVYAAAARHRAWAGRFTPSPRLWFSLIALSSLLQFLWISDTAPIVEAFADGYRRAGIDAPEGMALGEVAREAAAWTYGLMPILQSFLLVLLALCWVAWGERTSFALRLRYLLGLMIPSSTTLLVLLPVLAVMPAGALQIYGLVLAFFAFLIDTQTAARGFMHGRGPAGRIWRAVGLSGLIMLINVVSSIIAQIAGIVAVASKYGLNPS